MKLPILITTLNNRPEQVEAATKCFNSLVSKDHLLDIGIDNGNHTVSLTKKWNRFLEQWANLDYEYLIIVANDTYARPESIDYLVSFMEDNEDVMIAESRLNRDKDYFDEFFIEYSSSYSYGLEDTSNFIIRKGVIEKVGLFDEDLFPFSKNEQDYLYRCKLADIKVVQTDMKLFYHPQISMTLENRTDFSKDVQNYIAKWGGDWTAEKFRTPYNK